MGVKDWSPTRGAPLYEGKDTVIFRTWPDGDVVALFPEIPSDPRGLLCTSYMHVGQHGSADCRGVTDATRPARPEEWRALAKELTQIGYDLKVRARATVAMRNKRWAAAE